MYSLQEAFDKIVEHSKLQQKSVKASGTSGPLCRYRGDNGAKCFVGCLIKDEDYTSTFEEDTLTTVLVSLNLVDDKDRVAIQRLQNIHDQHAPSEWERELRMFAKEYVLEYKV